MHGVGMSKRIEDIDVRLAAKRRQALKLAEIRGALVSAGFDTTAKQAAVLGISRPTAWVVLNRDKRAGPSAKVLKRILSSPNLPPAARRKIEEYIEEKISGLYGHEKGRTRWFRDQFITIEAIARVASDGDCHQRIRSSDSAINSSSLDERAV